MADRVQSSGPMKSIKVHRWPCRVYKFVSDGRNQLRHFCYFYRRSLIMYRMPSGQSRTKAKDGSGVVFGVVVKDGRD